MSKIIRSIQLPYGNEVTLELTKEEVDECRRTSRERFPLSDPLLVFYGNDTVTVYAEGRGIVKCYYSIGD